MLLLRRRKSLILPQLVSKLPINQWPIPNVSITGGGSGATFFQEPYNAFNGVQYASGNPRERLYSNSDNTVHQMVFVLSVPVNLSKIEWRIDIDDPQQGSDLKVSINDGAFNPLSQFENSGLRQIEFAPTIVNKLTFTYNGIQGTYGRNGSTVRVSEIKLLGPG